MLFWVIAIALACVAAGSLLLPMLRRGDTAQGAAEDNPEIALYRDQLAEVDRDLARGTLDQAEADRARTEIARRLLAADKAGVAQVTDGPVLANGVVTAIGALVIVAGSLGTYFALGAPGYDDIPLAARLANAEDMRQNRASQAEAEQSAPDLPPIGAPEDYLQMVAQLREMVPQRPDELQGWLLLSRHETALGNYANAARAQDRVVQIKGPEATIDDAVLLLDLMVAATDGYVSPEAEAVALAIRDRDPSNTAAAYYLGLLYAQTDRADIAFNLWRTVIEAGDPNSPHVDFARGQILNAAALAGVEYELPDLPGPTADQVEAAGDMTDEDRTAMIEGMVEGLAERLATDGGNSSEWARLINALGVLGDTDRAAAIWGEAQQVFAAAPGDLEIIRNAARTAGVAE